MWIRPVIFVGILAMIIEIVLKRSIVSLKMLGIVLSLEGFQEDSAQIAMSLTWECAPVHGVNNLAT